MNGAPSEIARALDSRQRELVLEADRVGDFVTVGSIRGGRRMSHGPAREGGPEWGVGTDVAVPTGEEHAELERLGLLTDNPASARGVLVFQITDLGHLVAGQVRRLEAEQAAVTPISVQDLSWVTVQAHLRSIYEAWLSAGAPVGGVDVRESTLAGQSETSARVILEQLQEGQFIRFSAGSTMDLVTASGTIPGGFVVPTRAVPLNATVALFGSWPSSPQAAHEQLLSTLDAAIADEHTPPEERTKLEALRGQVTELAVGTAWTLLTGWAGLGG